MSERKKIPLTELDASQAKLNAAIDLLRAVDGDVEAAEAWLTIAEEARKVKEKYSGGTDRSLGDGGKP